MCRSFLHFGLVVMLGLASASFMQADELQPSQPTFFRGLNLNGPTLSIDDNAWDGKDAKWYESKSAAFENQQVELKPATDVHGRVMKEILA